MKKKKETSGVYLKQVYNFLLKNIFFVIFVKRLHLEKRKGRSW